MPKIWGKVGLGLRDETKHQDTHLRREWSKTSTPERRLFASRHMRVHVASRETLIYQHRSPPHQPPVSRCELLTPKSPQPPCDRASIIWTRLCHTIWSQVNQQWGTAYTRHVSTLKLDSHISALDWAMSLTHAVTLQRTGCQLGVPS